MKILIINDSLIVGDATDLIRKILEAKYDATNLNEIVGECGHLTAEEKEQLWQLLYKCEPLFDGMLGKWHGKKYLIQSKDNVELYHTWPFPILRVHEKTLRLEVEWLCQIGVLKKVNCSKWAAPIFIIPQKDGTVRFINDFQELNKRIKQKTYPILKIQDLLLKLEGFKYGTSLDLNMGYYRIELSPGSKELCTIVLSWGIYKYQRLPMGLCNSPDIFQEKMLTLMEGLEFVRAYIDDLLVITSGDFTDHLDKSEEVLKRLQRAGLRINAKKSFFGKAELEYLGYWITRSDIQPLQKKVPAIMDIQPPNSTRQVRRFVGMVNYYRAMWEGCLEILARLTKLCSTKTKFSWGKEQQEAFQSMKKILAQEVTLSYPNSNLPFEIHTDATDPQLGAVISQQGKPIAFYSHKLSDAQTRYTTTERELLASVETLKEYKNILLGQKITVCTTHKNLTFKNFNTDRVMCWRLVIKEFGPEFQYIQGKKNVVADALSRLDIANNTAEPTLPQQAELLGLEESEIPDDAYPIKYKDIQRAQKEDKWLLNKLQQSDDYTLHKVHGEERHIISSHIMEK